ncbi:hypothetical protein GF377_09255 [candidate division GN15 bacterium]|nr:hypothetical protein [candidate division GN15 bacterium]
MTKTITTRLMLVLMAASLLMFVVGCSSDSPATPEQADQPNLTDDFGGYSATDEAPGFGDPDLVAAEDEEEVVDDVMESSPEVQSIADDPESGRFRLRAIWGQLRFDSTNTTPTVWDGSLTVSRGAIVLKRLVRFELNQDGYFPRTDRDLLEWFSTTTVHNDGIVVDIYVPPAEIEVDTSYVVDSLGDTTDVVLDTLPVDPVTVTFETAPHTQTFTLAELASLDTVVSLGNEQGVAFQSVQILKTTCGRGHLTGRWGYDQDGNGVFHGLWYSHRGMIGYVRGHFGEDDDGNKVFFGKWINRSGQFEGFLRGTWSSNVSENASEIARRRAVGQFSGLIYDSNENEIGALRGRYRSGANFPNGWFHARWKVHCPDQPISTDNVYDDGI